MFVAIENKDKSPIDLEGDIQVTRNEGRITPEFAMDVLSLTNFCTNIKKLVRAIKDKCKTKEDILPYREFILSCVDEREMSGEAMGMLREMAKLCGCEDELETINKKPKFYEKTDCNNTIIVKSKEEFKALEGENLKVYFDAGNVYLNDCDLSKVKALKFREGAEVDLSEAYNLPKDLDVSMCSKVNLYGCYLEGLNLKFKEGAEVDLWNAKNLPKDLDVSMCSKVDLRCCDLEGLNLKFREGAEVDLMRAKNLPKDLDVSMCSDVDLIYCDLSGVKEIKFKDEKQEKIFMKDAKNFRGKVVYADEDKKEKEDNSLFSRIKKRFASGEMEDNRCL